MKMDQKCEFLVTGTAGSIYEVDREVCSGGGIGPPCCTYMLYVHTYGFSRPEKKHAKNIIVGLMEHFAVSVVEVEMKADQIPVNHRTKPESGGDRPVGCEKMPTSPGSCRQSNNQFHCTCGRGGTCGTGLQPVIYCEWPSTLAQKTQTDPWTSPYLKSLQPKLSSRKCDVSLPCSHTEDTYIKMISMCELNTSSLFSVRSLHGALARRSWPVSLWPVSLSLSALYPFRRHVHQNDLNVWTKYLTTSHHFSVSDDYAELLLDGPGRSLSGQSLSLCPVPI